MKLGFFSVAMLLTGAKVGQSIKLSASQSSPSSLSVNQKLVQQDAATSLAQIQSHSMSKAHAKSKTHAKSKAHTKSKTHAKSKTHSRSKAVVSGQAEPLLEGSSVASAQVTADSAGQSEAQKDLLLKIEALETPSENKPKAAAPKKVAEPTTAPVEVKKPEVVIPKVAAPAPAPSPQLPQQQQSSTVGGNGCASCAYLRSDMTHIAITTSLNQLVTIDMPMQEQKRITVRQNSLVVEDRDFLDRIAQPPAVPQTSDDHPKPVVIPTGIKKPSVKVEAKKDCPAPILKVEQKVAETVQQPPCQTCQPASAQKVANVTIKPAPVVPVAPVVQSPTPAPAPAQPKATPAKTKKGKKVKKAVVAPVAVAPTPAPAPAQPKTTPAKTKKGKKGKKNVVAPAAAKKVAKKAKKEPQVAKAVAPVKPQPDTAAQVEPVATPAQVEPVATPAQAEPVATPAQVEPVPSVEEPPSTTSEDSSKQDASGSDSNVSDASDVSDSESESELGDSDNEDKDADSGDEADESEVSDADDAGLVVNDLAQALGALLDNKEAAHDVLKNMLEQTSKKKAMKFAGEVFDELSEDGTVKGNEILDIMAKYEGPTISDEITTETKELVTTLNGKLNKEEWNALFGSLYMKIKA